MILYLYEKPFIWTLIKAPPRQWNDSAHLVNIHSHEVLVPRAELERVFLHLRDRLRGMQGNLETYRQTAANSTKLLMVELLHSITNNNEIKRKILSNFHNLSK